MVMEQPSAGQQQIMAMYVYGQQIDTICTIAHVTINFRSMVINASAITLSIMLQAYQSHHRVVMIIINHNGFYSELFSEK